MHITFDVSKFDGNPKALTSTLCYIRNSGNHFNSHDPEITKITCKTPSAAYRYTRYVSPSGLSEKEERVFLKNPNIGIKYLTFIRKKEFSNPDTQKRFWRKVVRDVYLSYTWASCFKTRLSEEEEEIFTQNAKLARDYAFFVIKGKFPEKIHNILVLKSFEHQEGWQKSNLQDYIKYAESKK